jgi:hypothetical protein
MPSPQEVLPIPLLKVSVTREFRSALDRKKTSSTSAKPLQTAGNSRAVFLRSWTLTKCLEYLSVRHRLLGLLSLAKSITLSGMSVSPKLEDSRNLQLEVDVARHLRLAAVAHIYSVLPIIVRYSCFASSYESCRRDRRKPARGGRDGRLKGENGNLYSR